MKKYLNILFSIFFFTHLFAQESLSNTIVKKIHSDVLNEDRVIDIQLPKNYANNTYDLAKYPVIYVLDGENNFTYIASLERFGTKFLYRNFPEMIVVGIRNTDRTRDFTPTVPKNDFTPHQKSFVNGGGADNFIKFIETELQPFINTNYRTNGFDILHGHSFGGLFSIYTLLSNQSLFDAYIALDPSLWWDNKVVYNKAKNDFVSSNYQNKSLFVALAYEAEQDAKDRLQHGNTIRNFCETILPSYPKKNFFYNWKYYPDYDHGTVPIPASFDALIKIFKGIELPVKEIPKNPQLLIDHYQKLSEKLGFYFIPEESLLIELIKYCKSVNKPESAKFIVNYALKIYPNNQLLLKMKSE
ncbi:alpha/beta hydrolase [Empedobacter brevis]|uniref:alpha/beta hydrolase n=1 Tax=Empedobacter brevis TaxID=247 RepID=UPI0039B0CB35